MILETLARELVAVFDTEPVSAQVADLDKVHALRNAWPLAAKVGDLRRQLAEIDAQRARYAAEIAAARDLTHDDLEIDEPILSVADYGVWVSAWVWVEKQNEDDEVAT